MSIRAGDEPTPPVETHIAHCRRLLGHAAELIAQGDRLQASEKLWGAAAHRIKALAAARDWPHQSHADGRAIARHVASRLGRPRIGILFMVAEGAHQNFYEDSWEDDDFTAALGEVRALIELLDAAERDLPPNLEPPTGSHYRRRHGLSGAAEGD